MNGASSQNVLFIIALGQSVLCTTLELSAINPKQTISTLGFITVFHDIYWRQEFLIPSTCKRIRCTNVVAYIVDMNCQIVFMLVRVAL